ncbi:MAG: hypothetical protein C4520_21770 [Candidatus Abyssobacteria bacterium SURF_5]|uniref:Uncharacterized protein n=1 Tax=Abyssobacteria bacterium (strain SURF_5) TaxID=2093360 RepID=A0A3A4NH30_ABYX5|nr:MAG: hypothetical protein C4520_21770 [Candidatus Abyssubacteria bacterium SURF_5]
MKGIPSKAGSILLFLFAAIALTSGPASASDSDTAPCPCCTKTASAAYKACNHEIKDDFGITIGNCLNLSDPYGRHVCVQAAAEAFAEAEELCGDQREARLKICEKLGEAAYDPAIHPEDFIDFDAVINGGQSFTPNPHFPLTPGTIWEYIAIDAEGTPLERILVEVLFEVKEILGVNCIVVHDRVWEIDEEFEEVLIEDTRDWYAQDKCGNVWYFGELAMNFEDGELKDIEGSWEAGEDFAKPGYIMLANPQPGDAYRQEFALGDAEDVAAVKSRDEETVSVPFGTFSEDVLETLDFNPLEPDVIEFKYYAPGVGTVLEVNPEDEERVELVNMVTP